MTLTLMRMGCGRIRCGLDKLKPYGMGWDGGCVGDVMR